MELEVIVIEPGSLTRNYWREAWQRRGLAVHLARRDLVARYKQTLVGFTWAFVRPVMSMIVFTVVFGNFAKLPSEGSAPYPLMVFAGLLPWQLFAAGIGSSSTAVIRNRALVDKIWFPRILLLVEAQLVVFFDFLISLCVLAVLMMVFAWPPDWRILSLPVFIALGMLTSFGLGLWLSALNVRFRDFAYLVPYLLQVGQFVSPVGFSSSVVPDAWRFVYSLNPLVGVVDGCRWALLGGQVDLYLPGLACSAVVAAALVWSGLWFFKRCEPTFADRI